MSLVAHFIVSESFEKKSLMLSCCKFDDSHTAENISSSILSHLQSWDIEAKVVCVAANMVAAMNAASFPSLGCLAHTLQLIIKDGIFQQPAVQNLLTSARSLVGFYNRSNTAFHMFQQVQEQLGLPKHSFSRCFNTLEQLILHATAPPGTKESNYCCQHRM